MAFSLRRNGWLLLGLLCAAGFAAIAASVELHRTGPFDRQQIAFWQGLESRRWTAVMTLFTFIGGGWPAATIALCQSLVLYAIARDRRELLLFLATVGGSAALNTVLKELFRRERPAFHRLIPETGFSFPSGHAMGALSLFGMTAYLLWKHIPVRWGRAALAVYCACLVAGIGASRIYLGVHYPTDVAAGYLASGCCVSLAVWGYQSARKYGISKERGVKRSPKSIE